MKTYLILIALIVASCKKSTDIPQPSTSSNNLVEDTIKNKYSDSACRAYKTKEEFCYSYKEGFKWQMQQIAVEYYIYPHKYTQEDLDGFKEFLYGSYSCVLNVGCDTSIARENYYMNKFVIEHGLN